MIEIRPFAQLCWFRNDWLNAHYHFSFARYHDPRRMGLGRLLVWNDDEIAPHRGFAPHPHENMEIITYVRAGAITHQDSLGNRGVIQAGDIQVMHAGSGIVHSEMNAGDIPAQLFQIWILPDALSVSPSWAMRQFPRASGQGLQVLASGRPVHAGSGALPLYADAVLRVGRLAPGETVRCPLGAERVAYLVPPVGEITVNGQHAAARDGVAIAGEVEFTITALTAAEIVLVEAASE
jgi:redox-sensitive bicupin YhaK (pirin superfamily)